MKKRMKYSLGIGVMAGLIALLPTQDDLPFTGHGDPQTLTSFYQQWKGDYENRGGAEVLHIGLAHSRALSKALTGGRGQVALNLINGQLKVGVSGLPAEGQYEVWFLNNHADGKTDHAIKVGMLEGQGEKRSLLAMLDRQALSGFTLDAVAVAKAGETPENGGLLFGSPGLMQRIYYSERGMPLLDVAHSDGKTQAFPFEFLLPKAAVADDKKGMSSKDRMTNLIAKGQKIFTKETFNGNGRTCASCHRPDNNHTLDPAYIAKLPKNDPLFVAEYNPDLKDLEKPALMRQFGLILANVDGFDNPGVMRSPSHLLGMSRSLKFETTPAVTRINPATGEAYTMKGEFVEDDDYFAEHNVDASAENRETEAIGWSGDGAPDGGALRDFAKGAVTQHMPKTLNRMVGSDFRMPTEDELDALEAYMLSLGRSEELRPDNEITLGNITFKSALVEKGKLLFDVKNNAKDANGNVIFGASANCNGCHMKAGAISSTTFANPTRDTGIERMRDQLHHLVDASVAYDGGFGQELQNDCGPKFDQACFSDGSLSPRGPRVGGRLNRFNTPSLIEAADTAPFFHNNSVSTLEEAVAYYNTDAFNNSPGAFTSSGANRQVKLDSSQVVAVAMFLRSINVLENIRSSSAMDQKAMALKGPDSDETIRLAMADTEDAIQVFTDAVINPYPEALEKLKEAYKAEKAAVEVFGFGNHKQKMLAKAIALKAEAKALIADGV